MYVSNFLSHFKRMLRSYNLIRTEAKLSRSINSFQNDNLEDLILKNTVITTNHLTPELKLRLITPECELWHCKSTESKFTNDPFWGIYWPGGQALSRFILDNKDTVKDKNVLDIGSGSGACAVAAVKSGAKIVMANDIDIASIRAIKINSKLNNVKVLVCNSNLIGKNIDDLDALYGNKPETPKWDVILIGDMFYDSDFSINLFHWLIELVKQEKTILIGDPGRHGLNALNCMNKVGQLIKIAEYKFENIEHYGFPNAAVYKVEAK